MVLGDASEVAGDGKRGKENTNSPVRRSSQTFRIRRLLWCILGRCQAADCQGAVWLPANLSCLVVENSRYDAGGPILVST